MERIEQDSTDEKERLSAGIALRATDAQQNLDKVIKYATEYRKAISIETLQAARDLLDNVLTGINAFLEAHPIPDETKSEI